MYETSGNAPGGMGSCVYGRIQGSRREVVVFTWEILADGCRRRLFQERSRVVRSSPFHCAGRRVAGAVSVAADVNAHILMNNKRKQWTVRAIPQRERPVQQGAVQELWYRWPCFRVDRVSMIFTISFMRSSEVSAIFSVGLGLMDYWEGLKLHIFMKLYYVR